MKVTIISDNENKLFNRKEVNLEISFTGKTPTGEEVKAEVGGVLKTNVKLVVVKGINQVYGGGKANVFAYIYNSEKDLKENEKKTRKAKKENKKKWLEGKKAGGKKQEASNGAIKEERKVEDKKEEEEKVV